MRKTKEELIMTDKEKRIPSPGDLDYKGGIFHTTAYINGKAYDVRTVKDAQGNIVSVTESPKLWGIF